MSQRRITFEFGCHVFGFIYSGAVPQSSPSGHGHFCLRTLVYFIKCFLIWVSLMLPHDSIGSGYAVLVGILQKCVSMIFRFLFYSMCYNLWLSPGWLHALCGPMQNRNAGPQVRMRKLVSSWVHHSNHSKSQGIATSMPGHSWFLGGSERKPWCVAQGRSCDTDFLPIFQGAMGHVSNPYSSCTCAPVEGDGGMWASLSQGDLVRTLEQGRECKAGRNPGDRGEEWAAWA